MNKNWLKDHIVELLAILGVAQFIAVIIFVLFKSVKSDNTSTMMILTSSTNIALMVLGFYFGSSKGSRDKQAKIDEIADSKSA